jgi:hypothetical protein
MFNREKQAQISRYRWVVKIASVLIGAGTKSILFIIYVYIFHYTWSRFVKFDFDSEHRALKIKGSI